MGVVDRGRPCRTGVKWTRPQASISSQYARYTEKDEVWELRDNRLRQRELDAEGKEKLAYGATLEVRRGVEGYYVDCKDGKCDAGDPRDYWRLENKGTKIVYTLWGVDPAAKGDPKASARKRVEYTFTPSP